MLSWSIKHVCVHTQGASPHADFADSRNKFRGPSVREAGVIFLPPQFHTEAINCSNAAAGAELLPPWSFLYGCFTVCTKAPDVLVWFPFGFPMHAMLHKTKRKDKVLRYSHQKKEDLICEKITSCINTYSVSCIAHRVPYFPVTWSNLLTTEEKSKSSINTSSPLAFRLSVSFWDTVSRDWKPRGVSCDPGLIWPMTSLRGGGQGRGGEGAVTSRADLLLPAVTSVWLRPANEDVIRSVSSAWHKLSCQRNWFNLFPPALKMNNQEVHTI